MGTQRKSEGYPGLSSVGDTATATVLRLLFDRINSIQGREGDNPTFQRPLVLQRNRITDVGDPTEDQDAVTLRYAIDHFGPVAQQVALSAAGEAPLPVVGLPGLDSVATRYGTHAERLSTGASSVAEGTLWFETDRAALYQSQVVGGTRDWWLVMCRPLRTSDALPGDLGTNDAGFTWFDQVAGYEARWSGGAWNYYRGSIRDVFANRPDPALADRGFLFMATDLGNHVWRKGATTWILQEGMGGPYSANAGSAPSLGADDAGFLWKMADFDRLYRWTGAAWEDAAGQPTRGMIVFFPFTNPGTGWAICDGGGATISTSSGGTTGITRPNLVTGENRFLRGSTVAGGTGGVLNQTVTVNPPATVSGPPSADVTVDANEDGTVVDVATETHTHSTDIAPFASSTFDNQPPYYDGVPYIRL